MKDKDLFLTGVLRLIATAIKNREIEKRTKLAKSEPIEKLEELSQLTDEEIMEVLASEIKKRKGAIEEFKKGNREDLIEKEQKEISVMERYLPAQVAEEEIRKIVITAINSSGATSIKEMGRVMGLVMPQVKGKADGEMVSRIVKEELEKSSH